MSFGAALQSLSPEVAEGVLPQPPPLQEAPPPVEDAPPPPPQESGGGGGGGSFGQALASLNAPPPSDDYIPGSTYVPPADRGMESAPPPPVTPRQQILPEADLPPDASLQDRVTQQIIPGAVNDLATSVQELRDQPSLMGKAGNVVGIWGIPFEKERNRIGRRAIDYATTGNPDATLGPITDVLNHPENIADSMPWDVVNPGGGEGEKDLIRYARENPDVVAEAVASGDDGLIIDRWLEDTGQTFDNGILGGVEGMLRQTGIDPFTPASFGVSGVTSTGARLASQAGKVGGVRGMVGADRVGQYVIDPIGMAAEESLRGLVPRIPGIGGLFRHTAATQQTSATDQMREAVGAGLQEIRQADGVSYPNLATPAPTPPQPTLALPANVTPDVIPGAGPPGVTPPPTIIDATWWQTPGNTRAPGEVIPGVNAPMNGRVTPPRVPVGPGSAPVVAPRPSRNSLPPIMRNRSGWVATDGSPVPVETLRDAFRVIHDADPDELRPFPGGRVVNPDEDTKLSQYLALMTERKVVLDDWPTTRPVQRPGDERRQAAGQAWLQLFSSRINRFQEREVSRLHDAFRRDVDRIRAGRAMAHERHPDYLPHRADAMIEAAARGGYTGDFNPHAYLARNAEPTDAPRFTPPAVETPRPRTTDEINAALADTIRATPRAQRDELTRRIQALWDDPEGLTGEQHKALRQLLYRTGVWSKEQYPRVVGYRRYTMFNEAHRARHGTPTSTPQARRSPAGTAGVYGDLSPQERAIADAVQAEFRAHLDQMGLGHVRLGVVDGITSFDDGIRRQTGDMGLFDPEQQTIDVAVRANLNHVLRQMDEAYGPDWALRVPDAEVQQRVRDSLYQTLNHETIHALRARGVFTEAEWRTLVDEAHAKGYGQWSANMYDDLAPRMQDEEAVAELFGDFALGRALSEPSRSILQKIVDLFTGFLRAVSRNDAEGVMRRVLSGEVGSRTPDFPDDLLPQGPGPLARRGPGLRDRLSGSILRQMDISDTSKTGEMDGLLLPEPIMRYLRNEITFRGKPTNMYEVGKATQADVEHLRFLATRHAATPLRGQDLKDYTALKKQFDAHEPRYDWGDAAFTADEVDRIAATHATDLWVKERYPNQKVQPATGVIDKAIQINADVMGFRRRLGLTNLVVWPRQFVVQMLGNVVGLSIAGRPDTLTGLMKPGSYVRSVKGARDPRILTDAEQFWKDMGFAPNSNAAINTGAKALSRNATQIQNRYLRKAADIFAPRLFGDIASAPDDVARGALARKTYIPGMRREQENLPKRAVDTWNAYHAKRPMPPVAPEQVEKVVRDTLAARKLRGDPISRATGQDIERAILDAFSGKAGVGSAEAKHLRDFADRVGRDYNTVRNTHRQMAGKEANRVLFTWDDTNIDAALKQFTLYHYWASRAGGLYLKNMVKKPAMGAAFLRLGQALNQEAEENNYPDWLKGFTRLINSPAGVTLLASPTDLAGNMLLYADWQWGREPMGAADDMSFLESAYGLVPLFFGPLVGLAAYMVGSDEMRLPHNVTGVEPIFTRAAQIINLANVNGHLPPGMLRDASGAPILVDPNYIAGIVQKFAAPLAGRQPIDLNAGFKNRQMFYLQDVLREENPEWADDPNGENELTRTMNEMEEAALRGEYTPEWLESERRAVQESLDGPRLPWLPEPLQGVAAGAMRILSPVRITSMPETKAMQQYGFGNRDRELVPHPDDPTGERFTVKQHEIGTTDDYDKLDLRNRPFDTLEMAQLQAANEDWHEVGMDSGLRDAVRTWGAIKNGDLSGINADGVLKIAGEPYTSAQLADLSKGERYRLAEKYLNAQGFTVADKDAYYAARDEIAKAHPDLGGFLAYKEHIGSYAGGVEGFTADAMRMNPSFAHFMNGLSYPPGSPDWYGMVDSPDAYYAVEGKRGSIYSPLESEPGLIPGLTPGETFAQRYAVQQSLDEAATAEGGGSGSGFDDFVAEIDKNVSNLYHAQRLWNETFPGWPLRVGLDFIDNSGGAYDYMKSVWKENGVYPPDKGDLAYEYYWEWLPANATAADHSVRAFLNQREDSGGGSVAESEPVTPEMIAAQLGIPLTTASPAVLTDEGAIDTSDLQRVTPLHDVEMRTGPSTATPINAFVSGASGDLWVTDIEGEWAQVTNGETVGWVPAATLRRAA